MRKTLLAAAAVAAVLSAPAFAQSQTSPATTPTTAPSATMNQPGTMQTSASGQWQGSKFIGLDVYNSQNEKIGDISEVMLDQSGKITDVVIGVGGFLGMGTHDVAVKWEQLKFVNEPVRTAASDRPATTGSATNPPAGTAGSAMRPATSTTAATQINQKKNYPDHAVLDTSKDQLKAMPAFKYDR